MSDLVWVVGDDHSKLSPLVDGLAMQGEAVGLRPAGNGWWILHGMGDATTVKEQLKGKSALIFASAPSGHGVLHLSSSIGEVTIDIPPSAPELDGLAQSTPIASWWRAVGGSEAPLARESRFWEQMDEGPPLREIASGIFHLLDLVNLIEEPWRALGQCLGPMRNPGARTWLGTRMIGPAGSRLFVGHGLDFYGVWDWSRPRRPVRTFTQDAVGLAAALDYWGQEAALPELETMGLEGQTVWGVADSMSVPLIVRMTPERLAFVIVCTPVPRTHYVARPKQPPTPGREYEALATIADAARLAEVKANLGRRVVWRSVPAGVNNLRSLHSWTLANQ